MRGVLPLCHCGAINIMTVHAPSICPVPELSNADNITLAHGEGGRLMRRLIRSRLINEFGNEYLDPMGDAAALPACKGPLVFTTDSFVVSPLFFPGGDIGSLSVYGLSLIHI